MKCENTNKESMKYEGRGTNYDLGSMMYQF
jgi:hypothetical protein